MPNKSYGSFLDIKTKQLVEGSTEIPKGQWAYVVNASTVAYDTIWDKDWEAFLAGDMSKFKTEIEKSLPGTQVEWVNFVWDHTEKTDPFFDILEFRWKFAYHVYAFRCEAIVKNVSGGVTGLEIIAIIIAVVIGIAILSLIALGVWITFQIMDALRQLGPAATVIGGVVILGGIGLLLLVLFGGRAEYKGKTRRFSIGRERKEA
jgi:hypothetical protein